ncbi:MAG: hypothetical protein JW957_06500 [Candidatus Omnitrophica bacterium]|nr:hypothetical protein [Candidatus Omnitrophota bacterium]
MRKYPDNYIIYEGQTYTVEWYYTEQGKIPGYEYFLRIEERVQNRFLYMVKYLADAPREEYLPKTMYNIEDKEKQIYAFKPADKRFFSFMFRGGKIIVTNAYRKNAQQMTKQDKGKLKAAIKYKEDYIRRIKEGVYYEKGK